jgi:hypothetical protein
MVPYCMHKLCLPFRCVSFVFLFSISISSSFSEPFFTIHGSNTIGARLAPELVKAFLWSKDATDIELLISNINESRIQAKMGGFQ